MMTTARRDESLLEDVKHYCRATHVGRKIEPSATTREADSARVASDGRTGVAQGLGREDFREKGRVIR